MKFKQYLTEQEILLQEGMLSDLIDDIKDTWKYSDKPEKFIIAGLLAATLATGGALGYGIKANIDDAKNLKRIETAISQSVKNETQENILQKYEKHLKLKKEAEKVITTWIAVYDHNLKTTRLQPITSHDAKAVAAYQESIKEFAELYRIDLK